MTQSKEFGENILKNSLYGVRVEGTVVVMTLGDKAVRMDYNMAHNLAAFLRHGAIHAKRAAHDDSSRWIAFADLTDANLDELQAQRGRDGSVFSGR